MSRIGKRPVIVPNGVEFKLEGSTVTVKGPKGTLTRTFDSRIGINKVEKDGVNEYEITRPNDTNEMKALHGTTNALITNMIKGVSEGFKKDLEIVGIGYRAAMRGENLVLNMGYSHEVVIKPEPGVLVSVADNTKVAVEGPDAQAVGQTAARIRAVREPEPYQGKGIRYKGEFILRKEGKRAGKK